MRRVHLAGLALLLLRGPAPADPPATTQWILATAKATGRGGEEFVSSLRIANPLAEAAHVDLTYLAQSPIDETFSATGDNGAAPKVRVTVGPGETLAIEDVLGTTFAGQASPFGVPAGGLRIDSDHPVSVVSRTFVANARSASGVPGTFGFSIPAQGTGQTVSAGETAWLTYASSAPSASSGFRTNLMLLNAGTATTARWTPGRSAKAATAVCTPRASCTPPLYTRRGTPPSMPIASRMPPPISAVLRCGRGGILRTTAGRWRSR